MTDYNPTRWPIPVPADRLALFLDVRVDPQAKHSATIARRTQSEACEYEDAIRSTLLDLLDGTPPDSTSRFGLRCVFYRGNKQRIDCDNLLKTVSDVANGVVWTDDSQVVEVFGRLFLASERPRVEIAIYRVDDPTAPRPGCRQCGKPVNFHFASVTTTFCSRGCFQESRRVDCVCPWCKKAFRTRRCSLRKGRTPFCSRNCSAAAHGADKTARSGPQTWKCRVCGGPASSRRNTRCRGCFIKSSEPRSNYWPNTTPSEGSS